ncbi:MAG: toxic anion resistance protein, partial [Gammaproteobacteria bacterium]|nr:toxic anion resistance protein [Gammaproteobacteria bacterium]
MSQSESNHKNVLVEQSTELQQQEFERLNLKELGLRPEDFAQ